MNTDRDRRYLQIFGAELRARRHFARLSLNELALKVRCPVAMLEAIEDGHHMPSPTLVQDLDVVLQCSGTLIRYSVHFPELSIPSEYRPYHDVEIQARRVDVCDHSLVPGVFQTRDYARAVLATRAGATLDDIEHRLMLRMARQVLIARGTLVHALIDECALRRPVQGARVMYDQFAKLDGLFDHPNITIQVLPLGAGGHTGLNGAFTLAYLPNDERIAYISDAAGGRTTEDAATLVCLDVSFDSLAKVALDPTASREAVRRLGRDLWTRSIQGPPGANPPTAGTTAHSV